MPVRDKARIQVISLIKRKTIKRSDRKFKKPMSDLSRLTCIRRMRLNSYAAFYFTLGDRNCFIEVALRTLVLLNSVKNSLKICL